MTLSLADIDLDQRLIVGAGAFSNNPFNRYTLAEQIEQASIQI